MTWGDHFTEEEFMCKCGCGEVRMHPQTVERIIAFRREWGKPIYVTSGYRCMNHPIERDKPESTILRPHVVGNAFDSPIKNPDRREYVRLAIILGFTGIGVYPWGIHLDDISVGQHRPAVW